VAVLRAPETIRERCENLLGAVEAGRSAHFTVERERLGVVAERVAALTRKRFPDGRIPYHSRWRHFEAGGVDRKAELDARLAGHDAAARACAQIDLALISVLVDAGAGPQWRYAERESGQSFTRSEGLAVASFRAFMAGRYSCDGAQPCRVEARALARIDAASLARDFQVGPDNPLVGLEGRAALLRRLGEALSAQPQTFGTLGRPGRLYDALASAPLTAARILALLLDAFSPIWPRGQSLGGVPLGDAWRHELAGGEGPSAGWVPFHKLSQWLAYSLLEPFEWAGVTVQWLDALTGLPEYRNGGLLLDAGVIIPRDAAFAQRRHSPADPWVIEWRALTVALLDELAPRVRAELGLSAAQMPLACVLEGGTWAAGREIAAERRPGSAPPVAIDSDGTIF
jgi:hypothetical protein